MNQSILTPLALALGLGAASAAHADLNGPYVSAGVGAASIERPGMGTASAWNFNAGWRWNGFGIEAGWNDFGTFGRDIPVTAGGATTVHRHDIDLSGSSIGFNDRIALDARWYVTARLGLFRWKTAYAYGPIAGARETYRDNGTDWYGGVGIGYRVSERFGIGLSADYLKAQGRFLEYTTNRLTLQAEYGF